MNLSIHERQTEASLVALEALRDRKLDGALLELSLLDHHTVHIGENSIRISVGRTYEYRTLCRLRITYRTIRIHRLHPIFKQTFLKRIES